MPAARAPDLAVGDSLRPGADVNHTDDLFAEEEEARRKVSETVTFLSFQLTSLSFQLTFLSFKGSPLRSAPAPSTAHVHRGVRELN